MDKGKLTAKKEGTAKIKAVTTVGKKSAYLTVRVKDPKKPTSIRLNATGKKAMRIGERFQIEYTLTPSTAQSSIIWVSSNKSVAGARKYIDAIKVLQDNGTLDVLDKKLQTVARARSEREDETMQELADRLKMSKTSLSRALNKLLAISEGKYDGRE